MLAVIDNFFNEYFHKYMHIFKSLCKSPDTAHHSNHYPLKEDKANRLADRLQDWSSARLLDIPAAQKKSQIVLRKS